MFRVLWFLVCGLFGFIQSLEPSGTDVSKFWWICIQCQTHIWNISHEIQWQCLQIVLSMSSSQRLVCMKVSVSWGPKIKSWRGTGHAEAAAFWDGHKYRWQPTHSQQRRSHLSALQHGPGGKIFNVLYTFLIHVSPGFEPAGGTDGSISDDTVSFLLGFHSAVCLFT